MLYSFCQYIASSLMPQGPCQTSAAAWTTKSSIPTFTSGCADSTRQFEIPVSSIFGNVSLGLVLYTYNQTNICNLVKKMYTMPWNYSSALITNLIFILQLALAHFRICPCDTYKMKNYKNPFSRLLEEVLMTISLL